MKYLMISNDVEVEPNAFKLLGACTKRGDDSKIGYFGSGLKYAMATFMREGIEVRIFAGEKEVKLGTVKERFRNEEFNVITIDGEKTSLTTSMGVDWKPWQAVREIYCNALDEENHKIMIGTCEPIGEIGKTIFYIGINEELEIIVTEWDKYFALDRDHIAICEEGRILNTLGSKLNLYRKGIRCYDASQPSLYDYDFKKIGINESRIINSWIDVRFDIALMWSKCATTKMIDELVELYKDPDKAKKHMEFDAYWSNNKCVFNNIWLEYFEDKLLMPFETAGAFDMFNKDPRSCIIKADLISALEKAFPGQITCSLNRIKCFYDYIPINSTPKISFLLKECLQFLDDVGLPNPYPIIIGRFTNDLILGSIDEDAKEIILDVRLFDKGKKEIVCTILEERAHIESRCGDQTRGFQDYLVSQMVTLLENQHGIFL